MLTLDMFLQFSLAGTFLLAKCTVGMFFLDVILELCVGREAKVYSTSVWIDTRVGAIGTEETWEAMHTVLMFA